jgi:predicted transglutaminase-like cysteine proteinase
MHRQRLTCLLSLCAVALLAALPVWSGLTDFSPGLIDAMQKRFGAEAPRRLQLFQSALSKIRRDAGADGLRAAIQTANGKAELALLQKVNDFFNKIPYLTDQEHWGVPDYWATPAEMVASWGGDCEDYAIAKYMSLKELGFRSNACASPMCVP